MSEIVFHDPLEDERFDDEIRRHRAMGLSKDRIAEVMGVAPGKVSNAIERMRRYGTIEPTPRKQSARESLTKRQREVSGRMQ
jgi:DNA-binding CsgD family transcriptional regulator